MSLTRITSDGITDSTITGSDLATNVDLVDNQKIRFGTANDLEIYHDGSNSYLKENGTGGLYQQTNGNGIFLQKTDGENMANFVSDGAVELYHNNVKIFETLTTGIQVTGNVTPTGYMKLVDNMPIYYGTGNDLEILHNGSVNIINSANNATLKFQRGGSDVWELKSTGLQGIDNQKLLLGTSDDLQIYHDSNGNNQIQATESGQSLFIKNDYEIQFLSASNEKQLVSKANGAVELYHNDGKKFETTASGVDIAGNCTITGNFRGNDNVKLNLGNSDDLQIFHDGSDSFIKDAGTGGLYIDTSQFLVRNAAGSSPNMEIKDDGRVFLPGAYSQTTSGSVNLRVLSDGQLKRSTSSIRYKKDITDATWGLTEVLKLKPKTFKNNATGEDADDKIYGGFTAEDIHDLGLTEFVDYNEKNEPDALAYGNMVALMAKAIQDLNGKVGILETEVAALKAS